MVSSEPLLLPVSLEGEFSNSMKEMIGGCCVCSDERGWTENPLVYCDGHGCSVAVHQGECEGTARPGQRPTRTSLRLARARRRPLGPASASPGPALAPSQKIKGGEGVTRHLFSASSWLGLSLEGSRPRLPSSRPVAKVHFTPPHLVISTRRRLPASENASRYVPLNLSEGMVM